MNLKDFLPEIRISEKQKRDYKEFILSEYGGYLTLISQIISIIIFSSCLIYLLLKKLKKAKK